MRRDPDGLLRPGEWCCGVSHLAPRSEWSASGSRIGEPSLVRPIEVITGGQERERDRARQRSTGVSPWRTQGSTLGESLCGDGYLSRGC